MTQDDEDFSAETTPAVQQWKQWLLRGFDELGGAPAGSGTSDAVERMRDLKRAVSAVERELAARRKAGDPQA